MKLLVLLFAGLLPLQALAQAGEIPRPVLDGLAKDLAQLHQAVLEAQRKQMVYDLAARGFARAVSEIIVTRPSANIRAGADERAPVLLSAKKNQTFPVIDKAGEWYAVELPDKAQGLSAGWVKADDAVPTIHTPERITSGQQVKVRSLAEDIYRDLTERAVRFRDAYRDNAYISVTGFSVNVGIPPSMSISFEFK